MLSGMNVKVRTDLDKAVADYLADGGIITKCKRKLVRRHLLRSKSHNVYRGKV